MSSATFTKDPGEITDYQIDWSDLLDALTISTSTWTAPAGITKVTSSTTTTLTTVRLSGGTNGTDYDCVNQVTLSNGQVLERSITIQVRNVEVPTSALVSTVGGASSNSYVSRAEAETYFASRLNASDWIEATETEKDQALITATRRIDQENFAGYRTTTTQSLKWPRSYVALQGEMYGYYANNVIPQPIKDAVCEMALDLLSGDSSSSSLAALEGLTKLKVGPIELEMKSASTTITGILPDPVSRLLQGLLMNSGGQIVRG